MKKKTMKLFTVLALLTVVSLPAFARNWVQIGEYHYIDTDSIRPSSTYGSYTFKTKYIAKNQPLERINGRQAWTVLTNSYIDCKTAYGKTISYTALDENDRTIVSNASVWKQWLNIESGSNASESFDYVCTDKFLRTRPGYHNLWFY